MRKLRSYLINNLSMLFYSIFLPLFAIASVIFLIKLATFTAVIQLSLVEMGKLYLFTLPELLFYTLPIAFIVSMALTLFRLSNDNEMVVLFTLGISPLYIARVFSLPAFLLSMLLLLDYIVITPYINIISNNFLNQKKAEAKFNLSASEFGHHFGEWMLFINKDDPHSKTYTNVVLFNKSFNDEILINAKKADMMNRNGSLQLKLDNGSSYSFNDEKFRQLNFKTAYINDAMKSDARYYKGTLDYWMHPEKPKRIKQLFITNALLSLFPLLSIFMATGLGIVHARHQKRHIYLWLFLSIFAFYGISIGLQSLFSYHTIWVVSLMWLIGTYMLHVRLVGRRF